MVREAGFAAIKTARSQHASQSPRILQHCDGATQFFSIGVRFALRGPPLPRELRKSSEPQLPSELRNDSGDAPRPSVNPPVSPRCSLDDSVSTRGISFGEELTFDYACVSESREEFASATCLCGSVGCRGSFVAYADERSFMQVVDREYGLLRRVGDLLWVCEGAERELGERGDDGLDKDMSIKDMSIKDMSIDGSIKGLSIKDESNKDGLVKESNKDESIKGLSNMSMAIDESIKDWSNKDGSIDESIKDESNKDMSIDESNKDKSIKDSSIKDDSNKDMSMKTESTKHLISKDESNNDTPINHSPIKDDSLNDSHQTSSHTSPIFPPLPPLSRRLASLATRGLKSAVFFQTPPWVAAWAFTVSSFLSRETEQLPAILQSIKDPRGIPLVASLQDAIVETAGVSATRLQNLAISIDRIRHFLRKQPENLAMKPPLHLCSEDEILDYFWFDRRSVMWRIVEFGETLASDETADSLFSQYKRKLQNVHYYCSHREEIRIQMTHCI